MPLSERVLDELEGEYQRMLSEAEEVAVLLRRHGRLPSSQAGIARPPSDPVVRAGADEKGLREAILGILASAKRGFKPSELTRALEAKGFPQGNAQTPLSTRVSSEMARLHRDGKIDKADNRYRAKPPADAAEDFEDFPGDLGEEDPHPSSAEDSVW